MTTLIKKAQTGTQLIASNVKKNPLLTDPAAPAAPAKKRTIDDYLKDYSEYTRLKYGYNVTPDPEFVYRQKVKNSMESWNGKSLEGGQNLTPAQKANRLKIMADGHKMNYCQLGACKVLNDAGDVFTGEHSVDNAYFGTGNAKTGLPGDGFAVATDPTKFKMGDMFHIRGLREDGSEGTHAALYADDVLDETGKKVGMKALHNNGDGREHYVYYLNDDKYLPKGGVRSSVTYSDLMDDYNTTGPVTGKNHILTAYTKQFSQEAMDAYKQKRAAENAKRDELKAALMQWGEFKNEEEMDQLFRSFNAEKSRNSQVRIYKPVLARKKQGGTIQWLR